MKEFNFEKELLGVQDELFRFAYKLTANREKAEDLLQDTLLKAMLHKESYNKNTNFKGWLFIIMRNTFINGYRAEVGHTRLYISSDPAYYSRIMDESRTEEGWKTYRLVFQSSFFLRIRQNSGCRPNLLNRNGKREESA